MIRFSRRRNLVLTWGAVVMTVILTMAVVLVAQQGSQAPDVEVRVSSVSPRQEHDRRENITLTFSNDLAPEGSIDVALVEPPVSITPPIAGEVRWVDARALRIFPEQELAPATEYELKVLAGRMDHPVNRMAGDTTIAFHTPWLSVTHADHGVRAEKSMADHVRLVFTLSFNYEVDDERLERHVSIRGDDNAAMREPKFDVVTGSSARRQPRRATVPGEEMLPGHSGKVYEVVTEPLPMRDKPQQYTLRLEPGLACEGCGRGMPVEFTLGGQVRGSEPLVVQRVVPRVEGMRGVIDVVLSSPVVPESAREYVAIDPEVDYTLTSRWRSLRLGGQFAPGESYTLTLKEGLTAEDGRELAREFSQRVQIPDIPPTVQLTDQRAYLRREGLGNVELRTVNVGTVVVKVEQVFVNNLVPFLSQGLERSGGWEDPRMDYVGRRVYRQEFTLGSAVNEELVSTVDVAAMIPDTASGIFRLTVHDKERQWMADSRRIVLTDHGIFARLGEDYLMVWTRELQSLQPVHRAEVRLISRNNQVLMEGKTDSRGVVEFDELGAATEGFEPYLITVQKDGDLSFLLFEEAALDYTRFDVSGRPYLLEGYEAYMTPERGVYRPGDTVHVSMIVRGVDVRVPEEFPFVLEIRDPRGREYESRRMSTTDGEYVMTADIAMEPYAPTGSYSAVARIGEEYVIGRTSWMVEEFVPDRIRVNVTPDADEYMVGDTLRAAVAASFYFGPPVAGQSVSGQLVLEAGRFSPARFDQYTFADEQVSFSRVEQKLPVGQLDSAGQLDYELPLPELTSAPSVLKGLLGVTVTETGGRGVADYAEVRVHPYERYVGLARVGGGYAEIGVPVELSVVAVDVSGAAVAVDSIWVHLERVVHQSVLRYDNERGYHWESERSTERIDSQLVGVSGGPRTVTVTPPDYGRYRVRAVDVRGGHVSAVAFYASGAGWAPWSMEQPDRVDLSFDEDSYAPDERATLLVKAPFDGTVLVTVERDEVLEQFTVEMEENTTEIELQVRKEWQPNVYVTTTVIRPVTQAEPHEPLRAFGMVPLMVDPSRHALKMRLSAPELLEPKDTLVVEVETRRLERSAVVVAAVDAAVLALTDFEMADPVAFFWGQRRPYLKPYDIYSLVFPEREPAESHLSPGGDRQFAQARKRHVSPTTVRRIEPVALYSGVVQTDDSGRATVSLPLPQFNGQLRVMVLGATGQDFGLVRTDVTVRDRIVLAEAFPRFVAPNDLVHGMATVFNNDSVMVPVEVRMVLEGPAGMVSDHVQAIDAPPGREVPVRFSFRALDEPGKITVHLSARTATDTTELEFALPNRPAQPLTTQYGSGSVAGGDTTTFMLPGEWLDGTGEYVVQAATLSAVQFAWDIQYLLRYPYGCLEQVTSRLMPLLQFEDLADVVQPEVLGGNAVQYYVQEGLDRLTTLALDGGGFSFWAGTSHRNRWASVWATHCLVEARSRGYVVNGDVYEAQLDHLSQMVRGVSVDGVDLSQRLYAAYVLGVAGELERSAVSWLSQINTMELKPYERFLLAGTLGYGGEVDLARGLLPTAVQPHVFEPETGGNFNSGVRTDAILLLVMLQLDPNDASVVALVQSLMERQRDGHWYATQDRAWALMALGRFFRMHEPGEVAFDVTVGADTMDVDFRGEMSQYRMTGELDDSTEVTIATEGTGDMYYYWQASGVPKGGAIAEYDRGMRVRRSYFTEDGDPLDLRTVTLGMRVVVQITAEATQEALRNVVINDMLPSGMEIENPRLQTSAALSWVHPSSEPVVYRDMRDDRMLLFADLQPERPLEFYYTTRVITAGEFVVPPVMAECMYNPLIASASSSGQMVVIDLR